MVNAETGIRGYAAVRDPLFLVPYNLALARINADRDALRDAASAEGDLRQNRGVDATTSQALASLAQLRSAVSHGTSIGQLRLTMERQKTTMDLLRRRIARLTAGPTALAAATHHQVDRQATVINLLDVAGLALGVLAGLAGIALFTSGISSRVSANALNAGRLGAGQRLEPVPRAGDEIGWLSESLSRPRSCSPPGPRS